MGLNFFFAWKAKTTRFGAAYLFVNKTQFWAKNVVISSSTVLQMGCVRGYKINYTKLTSALFATFLAFVSFGFAATLVPFGLVTSPAVSRHVNCKSYSVSIPARVPVSRIRHSKKVSGSSGSTFDRFFDLYFTFDILIFVFQS